MESQISKKWDNLKRKYQVCTKLMHVFISFGVNFLLASLIENRFILFQELRCPPTGTGTDSGEATAATWPWFSAVHETIGGRPSIEPPILIDSCDAEVTSCSAVSKDPGLSPSASVEESEEEDTTSSAPSGTDNFQEERPCTSSGPLPPKKKRSN